MTGTAGRDLPCAVQGPQLAAFLDGELGPDDEQRLEAHVAGCPRCTADLAEQRRVRAALRRAGTHLRAPDSLGARIESDFSRGRRPFWGRALALGGLAAALVIMAVAGLLWAASRIPDRAVLARAAGAHEQESLSQTPVTFASGDAAAVAAWARSATGEKPDVPSFAAAGYRLLGARLEPSVGRHAVSLVYQGEDGSVTCTVVPVAASPLLKLALAIRPPAIQTTAVGGATAVSWTDADATYILLGDAGRQTLLQLARLAAQAG